MSNCFNRARIRPHGPKTVRAQRHYRDTREDVLRLFQRPSGRDNFRHEIASFLDWIGFSVDVASLKVFFAQNALTILAVWEALNSIVRKRRHSAAFDVLLSVYLSITDQAPWTKPTGRRFFDFPSIVDLAPTRAVTLLNASLYDQRELDAALGCAARYRSLTEVVKQLVSAGASLKNSYCRTSVDRLICGFRSREGFGHTIF